VIQTKEQYYILYRAIMVSVYVAVAVLSPSCPTPVASIHFVPCSALSQSCMEPALEALSWCLNSVLLYKEKIEMKKPPQIPATKRSSSLLRNKTRRSSLLCWQVGFFKKKLPSAFQLPLPIISERRQRP
jgi:hypothetical protein